MVNASIFWSNHFKRITIGIFAVEETYFATIETAFCRIKFLNFEPSASSFSCCWMFIFKCLFGMGLVFLSYHDNLSECMCWFFFLCCILVLISRLLSLVFQHSLSVCQWDVVCTRSSRNFDPTWFNWSPSINSFWHLMHTWSALSSCDLGSIYQTFLKPNNVSLFCLFISYKNIKTKHHY